MGTLVLKIVYFILITLFSEYVTGANEMEFRLKKFDDQANDGIAQLLFNGTLGAVDIADPDINVNFTAKALCNSIGLGYKGFTSRNYNGSPMLTWINDFTCNASYAAGCIDEKSLILRNTTLSAIVHCYAYEVTDIRLTGDVLPSRGFVEFKITERWVAVNTSKFSPYSFLDAPYSFLDAPYSFPEADDIGEMFCKALGYVGESIILPETRGSGNTIMTIRFDRTGYCSRIESIFNITGQCETNLYLSTSSFMQINCMPIRLVDGPSVLKGRIETTLSGRIHTICGLGFDTNAANVACKSLGFRGLSNLNLKTEYGVGNLTLYSRKISCNGTELSLEQCNHSNVDIEACGVEDVVSVTCKGNQVQLEAFSEARPYEGLLTAYYDSHLYYSLGPVDVSTARTLCSWLGFGEVGFAQVTSYQTNSITNYCKLFRCTGNESYIDECSGTFSHLFIDCTIHGQVTGLFCSDYKIQRINLVSDVIQLKINNETWSVCGDTAASETFRTTADTVCRINGNTTYSYVTISPIQSTDHPAIGSLTCESGSLTAEECIITHLYEIKTYGAPTCQLKSGVVCSNALEVRETGSNLLITAILSSIGGVIFFVIIITAAVCYIRKHKVTSVGKQNASQSSQHYLDTIDYSTGRVPADVELDENACTDNPYQEIKEGNEGSNDYIELSESLNDNYDRLNYAKMQMLRSEDLASDGYLKPIQKERDTSGERLRPQGIKDGEPGNDLPIMSSQLDDDASDGYLRPV